MNFEFTQEMVQNNIKFWYTLSLVFILARFFYYPKKGKQDYLFAYVVLSAVIFMICLLIKNVELGLGFAVGIFAIFGIIRYRTVTIETREMTYLFLCIGIAAKNALVPIEANIFRVLYSDVYVVLIVFLLEYVVLKRTKLHKKEVVYTKLDLIHPNRRSELEKDLNDSYGFGEIRKIKVGKIDQAKQTARLQVTFKDGSDNHLTE